jgi:ankyrin repeat protein
MYNKIFILLVFFYLPLDILALPDKDQFKYICILSKDSAIIQSDLLQSAIEHQTEGTVKRWLQKLPNTIKTSPLLFAVQNNADLSIVKTILKYIKLLKEDFYNIHDMYGASIISMATINNNIALVKLLLKYDVPLTWNANNFKESPLHIAAKYNYLELFKLMLAYTNKTLNIHSCDTNNLSPLSYLILNQQSSYVISLLFKYQPSYTIAYIGTKSYYKLAKCKNMNAVAETLDSLFQK